MSRIHSQPHHGLALLPLRHGHPLRCKLPNKFGCIPLWNHDNVILGRMELLPCLYAACGCDSKITSTQRKCEECQAVNVWATKALSREMIRISGSELYVRERYAVVLVNDNKSVVEGDETITEEEWRGSATILEGTKISFKPKTGKGLLEFQVVSVDCETREILDPAMLSCLTDDDQQEDDVEDEGLESSTPFMETQLPFPSFLHQEAIQETTPDHTIKDYSSAKTPRVKNSCHRAENEEARRGSSDDPQCGVVVDSQASQSRMRSQEIASKQDDLTEPTPLRADEDSCPSSEATVPRNNVSSHGSRRGTQYVPNVADSEATKIGPSTVANGGAEASNGKQVDPGNHELSDPLSTTSNDEACRQIDPSSCDTDHKTETIPVDLSHETEESKSQRPDPPGLLESESSKPPLAPDPPGQTSKTSSPVMDEDPPDVEREQELCITGETMDSRRQKFASPVEEKANTRSSSTTPPQKNNEADPVESHEGSLQNNTAPSTPVAIDNRPQNYFTPGKPSQFVLYFCPIGQDLPQARRVILAKKVEAMGARVVEDWRLATHIVVSEQISSLAQVAERLEVKEEKLVQHLNTRNVQCVVPKWIANASGTFMEAPSRMETWLGYWPEKRKPLDSLASRSARKKLRFQTESESMAPRNQELSDLFRKLSKLHQSCPLLPVDSWKAYCFSLISGRLRHLDFDITNHPEVLDRVKKIKGIGASSFEKIKEYLDSGTISRIGEFQTDPKRVAMKKLMDIWGVGRVKASALVHNGFSEITQIREAVDAEKIELDRNQLVGVECYEDILEEMGSEEVEKIGGIIGEAFKASYPNAEVNIMGSYRRGKESCGDVDVHITCRDYVEQIPEQALGEVVDALWEQGHIAFHLTHLRGMQTGFKSRDYQKSSRFVPKHVWDSSTDSALPKYSSSHGHSSSSYMGVFHSPTITGKRRRIDIKFYPHRERIFASLYFTGNGHFNRSMRLWAARKFNFTLNDHGLFVRGTEERVMEASREKDIFDKLNLVYMEPHERDSFDAVVAKSGNEAATDFEATEQDFQDDIKHVWVA